MENLLRLSIAIRVLVLCVWRVSAQTATTAVISPSLGFNASLRAASTVFQCDVTGANNIEWRVDTTPSNRDIVTARGIETSTVMTIDSTTNTLRSTLTVPTTESNDNTMIFCIAENDSGDVNSDTVLHLVQGLLDPPSQLEIVDIQNSFMRRLSWDAPETIDLTDIDPDISNYTVCFNISGGEMTCESVPESSQEYVFTNLRVPLLFSVSALNVVGEGNASTIEHEACDRTTAPAAISGSEVDTQLEFQPEGEPSLIISFPQAVPAGADENCLDVYRVQLTQDSNSLVQGPFILTVTEASGGAENQRMLSITIDSGISSNELYSVSLITVNVNGEASSIGDITFSSYDVQAVGLSAIPGGLELSCSFAAGSEAQNCRLRVCQRENGETIDQDSCQDVTILRDPGPSSVTLADLDLGVYSIVEVIETEKDGNETTLNLEALLLMDVEISEEEPTTPPATTTPSVQTPGSVAPSPSTDTTPIIIGCVVGGVAIVILLFVILVVLFCICKAYKSRKDKLSKENESFSRTQLWQEESDGMASVSVVTSTQINGESTSPGSNPLNPLYEDPMTTIAVIQGGAGEQHSVIRTGSNTQQSSTNDSIPHTRAPYTGEQYALVDKSKKTNQDSDKTERSATSPLYTDIMRSTEKIDLSERDSIEKIPLTNSERSINSDSEKPKLSFEDLKASSESLLSTSSQTSMTGSHPTYAELEHHGSKKKKEKQQPSDKTGVLYSEIKVDEIPPVLPQKKVRSNSSLKREEAIPRPVSGQSHLV